MKKTFLNYKKFICIFIFLLIFSISVEKAFAYIPFGGRISLIFPCSCNASSLLTVGPPKGGEFMYGPGSYSYMYGPPSHVGQWLLGLAGSAMFCINPVCEGACCPNGAGLFILFHGSSM